MDKELQFNPVHTILIFFHLFYPNDQLFQTSHFLTCLTFFLPEGPPAPVPRESWRRKESRYLEESCRFSDLSKSGASFARELSGAPSHGDLHDTPRPIPPLVNPPGILFSSLAPLFSLYFFFSPPWLSQNCIYLWNHSCSRFPPQGSFQPVASTSLDRSLLVARPAGEDVPLFSRPNPPCSQC